MENKKTDSIELFFPYYVNQSRLLDIYSILNGGYSEYSEITTAVSTEKSKGAKADVAISGGFKLFNFGGTISGNADGTEGLQNENKTKKVHTVTSVLSLVKGELEKRKLLKNILNAGTGEFICIPVVLSINSIKSMLSEMGDLLKLITSVQKLGVPIKNCDFDSKKVDDVVKAMHILFEGEEILYETEEFAVVGNIVNDNLYQAARAGLIGTQLMCLAQIKRIYPDGTELMKNTIFTKIKDKDAKQKLISSMSSFTNGETFDFEATAVASIYGKPVYQLEIIALYQ